MCYGLISVRRRYSKSYPSPAKSPLSLQCLVGLEMEKSLLVWLLETNLSKCRKCTSLFPSNEQQAVILVCQHPDLKPGKLRADSAEGGAQSCFFELPHSGEPGPHHVPRIPVTCEPRNSSKLLGLSLSLSPRLIPIIVGPAMNRSELGEV